MQTLAGRRSKIRSTRLVLLAMVALGVSLFAQAQNTSSIATIGTPEPIYSKNPGDPWNRIFSALFSRRLKVRLSDQFPEGAPFIQEPFEPSLLEPAIHVSTKAFECEEIGDRAIDPLYPYFSASSERRMVFIDPLYSEFVKALQESLDEKTTRPAASRALMQSDLWAAYDILFHSLSRSSPLELEQHRQMLCDLLGRLIKKIALTSQEIKSLPHNYASAVRQHS